MDQLRFAGGKSELRQSHPPFTEREGKKVERELATLALAAKAPLTSEKDEKIAPRRYGINIEAIERRTGERHVNVTGEITRQWDEVKLDAVKSK